MPASMTTTVAAADLAQSVINACELKWEANKADCSGFAKAVATEVGLSLSGNANAIMDSISSTWESATDGADAARKAGEGKFVIGGLKATGNGHVVVVVKGPLNREKYPTAYWGRLDSVGAKNTTINWSFNATDRDKVTYYYTGIGGTGTTAATPVRVINWGFADFWKRCRP